MPPVVRTPRAATNAPAAPDGDDPDEGSRPPRGPSWPVPPDTERPHTGPLLSTVAMLASSRLDVSAGYTSAADLIPVVTAA